jgi:hypothetical protein
MRRLVVLLGLAATVVGALIVLRTRSHYGACVNASPYGQGFGASTACQHIMWEELSAVVVLSAGVLSATIALLLGRNRRSIDRKHERRRAAAPERGPMPPPFGRVVNLDAPPTRTPPPDDHP